MVYPLGGFHHENVRKSNYTDRNPEKDSIIDRDKPYALQGYSFDQRQENVDIDFNVPHTPIVGLGQ